MFEFMRSAFYAVAGSALVLLTVVISFLAVLFVKYAIKALRETGNNGRK